MHDLMVILAAALVFFAGVVLARRLDQIWPMPISMVASCAVLMFAVGPTGLHGWTGLGVAGFALLSGYVLTLFWNHAVPALSGVVIALALSFYEAVAISPQGWAGVILSTLMVFVICVATLCMPSKSRAPILTGLSLGVATLLLWIWPTPWATPATIVFGALVIMAMWTSASQMHRFKRP